MKLNNRSTSRVRLRVRRTRHGLGVVAASILLPGTEILVFRGPRLSASQVSDFSHSLQVGPDLYLGPSGGIDDLVNHSCEPNCGLSVRDGQFTLVALQKILPGKELTFDYSTSMSDEPWTHPCHCGSDVCRGIISGFWSLPHKLRKRYVTRGIVPQHVLRSRPVVAGRTCRNLPM